jgi:MoaA/NifB/PqqE/SkfB family radical SAM enzyme
MDLVPSTNWANASAALEELFAGINSLSIAVAFVSDAGVTALGDLMRRHSVNDVELVARGAPITDPIALERAQEELGIKVSAVVGPEAQRFHPKLWLLRIGDEMRVLSGSGNLTAGGLRDNREQFEVMITSDPDVVASNVARYEDLTAGAIPLERMRKTIAWDEWLRQIRERDRLHRELSRLDQKLAKSSAVDREDDRRRLLADLNDIYARTVAATNIRRRDGQKHVPSRFLQGIKRAEESGNPVRLVFNMCRHKTEGFDVLLEAKRPDLTVEALVVNEGKSYHDLFQEETKRLSAERLEEFGSHRQD